MRISTKGRYGLKVMYDLTLNEDLDLVPLSSIAERQHISISYLEQIMILLRKANLVESVRGAQGGYRLARSSQEITIGEVLNALVGSLAPTDCLEGKESEDVFCIPREVYAKIYKGILDVVDNTTLYDMKKEYYSDHIVKEIVDCKGGRD